MKKNADGVGTDLFPRTLWRGFPAFYSQEAAGPEALVRVKFFNPCGAGTWYATEAMAILEDGREVPLDVAAKELGIEDIRFFGLCEILEKEIGYFSLKELQELRCPPLRLPVERDLYFKPRPLKELMDV